MPSKKKANSKKNKNRAAREQWLNRKLTYELGYTLDDYIRQRYPKFIYALRDLGEWLKLVYMFAALPAGEKIPVDRVRNCRMLSLEWQAYISRTHKLRKTFLAKEEKWYQAEVYGEKVTWTTPYYRFKVPPAGCDYESMLPIVEFNEALLAFVNYKLYHSVDLKYPPFPELNALEADLDALSIYSDANVQSSNAVTSSGSEQIKNQQKGTNSDDSELRLALLQQQLPSNGPTGALMNLLGDDASEVDEDSETRECKNLFKNMKFFLSRQVLRESLLFVILAFGGTVSWEGEGAPFEESDHSITHQVVASRTLEHTFPSREYVHPQWVYDCVNERIRLPTEEYMVGRVPPPHWSPFVAKPKKVDEGEAKGKKVDEGSTSSRNQQI